MKKRLVFIHSVVSSIVEKCLTNFKEIRKLKKLYNKEIAAFILRANLIAHVMNAYSLNRTDASENLKKKVHDTYKNKKHAEAEKILCLQLMQKGEEDHEWINFVDMTLIHYCNYFLSFLYVEDLAKDVFHMISFMLTSTVRKFATTIQHPDEDTPTSFSFDEEIGKPNNLFSNLTDEEKVRNITLF